MPVVDRNILRLALFELLHEPETPRPVVIDEALEIAKRFSTPKSSQFINGILDGVLKARRGEAVGVRRAARALLFAALLAAGLPATPAPTSSRSTARPGRTRGSSTSTTTTVTRSAVSPAPRRGPRADGPGLAAARSRAARRSRRPPPATPASCASPERDAFARTLAGDARDAGRRRRADPRGDRLLPALRPRPQPPPGPGLGLRVAARSLRRLRGARRRPAAAGRHRRADGPGRPADEAGSRRLRRRDRRRLSPLDRGLLPGPRVRLLRPLLVDQRRRRAVRAVRAPGARAAAGPDGSRPSRLPARSIFRSAAFPTRRCGSGRRRTR